MSSLTEVLNAFTPITLAEMDAVELMDRKDTKYFFDRSKLIPILELLQSDYRVLEITPTRLFNYRNIYFDTSDFFFYTQHHNERVNRYKIRIRQYVESNMNFLEVKFKTNTKRTLKSRIKIPAFTETLTPQAKEFLELHTPFKGEELMPALRNDFKRFTLVNTNLRERATIDTDLELEIPGQHKHFSRLCIAELKIDSSSSGSAFKLAMRDNYCPEMRISKYSVGAAFMYEDLKQNNFKEKKIRINRIEHAFTTTSNTK